jgi:hypothetical protein
VRANQRVNDFAFGIGIFNADGICCYGTNTHIEGALGERAVRRRTGDPDDRLARSCGGHIQTRRRRSPAERRAV